MGTTLYNKMGNFISNCLPFTQCSGTRVIIVGPEHSGKTSLMYSYFRQKPVLDPPHQIGFHYETLRYKHINMATWDLKGGVKVKRLWKHYFLHTRGIFYVLDSRRLIEDVTNNENTSFSSEDEEKPVENEYTWQSVEKDLKFIRNHKDIIDATLICFCNRQEEPDAIPFELIQQRLSVNVNVEDDGKTNWIFVNLKNSFDINVFKKITWNG